MMRCMLGLLRKCWHLQPLACLARKLPQHHGQLPQALLVGLSLHAAGEAVERGHLHSRWKAMHKLGGMASAAVAQRDFAVTGATPGETSTHNNGLTLSTAPLKQSRLAAWGT